MLFHKIPAPQNFRFARSEEWQFPTWTYQGEPLGFHTADLGNNLFRLSVAARRWGENRSVAELADTLPGPTTGRLSLSDDAGFLLADALGQPLLRTVPGQAFGVCGDQWMFLLEADSEMRFFGMGEKNFPMERSGRRTQFWNTDVWADFPSDVYVNGNPDPVYVSIPWLLIKLPETYVGILVNNPFPVFLATPDCAGQPTKRPLDPGALYFGAAMGTPDLFVTFGTLPEVTQNLQLLCGTTPRPPLWALGYHQSRWGYRSGEDLRDLKRNFEKHRIPCSGLWLDIDYMEGFRVFTWAKEHFHRPDEEIAQLREAGYHVVPIIDPGVKKEKGYPVYDDGVRHSAFCLTPEKGLFSGWVWPGETVFPDFSTESGRDWWGRQVADFAATGISGAWLDMNDPATGHGDYAAMRFDGGTQPHETFHNQYALGMAQASRQGFLQADPDRRPFLISRSGYIGISRHAGIWTGDNYSNWHHLQQCIPTSVNLALSGVPLNAPDVPGFGGDASPELAEAWFKTCFLFPFLRNHSATGTKSQEPWAFRAKTRNLLRRYIRLRYRFLPYLYNLFIEQERIGEAVLRPIFYDVADSRQRLAAVNDQFMIGPAIMQAPIVAEGICTRSVQLPPGDWFDARNGRWLTGDRTIRVRVAADETPFFVRAGNVVPMLVGEAETNRSDLGVVEFHVFPRLTKGSGDDEIRGDYRWDDGISFRYRCGEENRLRFRVTVRGARVRFHLLEKLLPLGPVRFSLVLYREPQEIRLVVGALEEVVLFRREKRQFTGKSLDAWVSHPIHQK